MQQSIEIRDLRKRYGEVTALDGVGFSIASGEVFGLLGPNGAGKTTTIHIIAQVIKPDSGQVVIEGLELARDGGRIKGLLGFVPQELAIYPELSARENLELFGRLYGLAGSELKSRVGEALEMVGLAEAGKRASKTFSGGMKRRLNIACGLLHRPKLLLLDEPAVGVDPQSRSFILESIRRFNTALGMTILYTSHYMEEVEQICSRAAIIDHGRIIADDSVERLIQQHGGGSVVITLDTPAAGVAAELAGRKGLGSASAEERMLVLRAERPQQALPGVLEFLNAKGIKIEGLEIRRANLEAVFLNLTGRSLRDE
jgi:ABC-2 type transport system ATP-binding protein